MSLGNDQKPAPNFNFILTRIVAGLWQGNDQFAITDAEMLRAYGSTRPEPLLDELGEGWGASPKNDRGETILTRLITARKALEQLGF